MKRFRGEILFYSLSIFLYVWFLAAAVASAGFASIDWGRYPVFIPSALLVLGSANYVLRSKVLAWGIFTLGFLCFMAVLGACILTVRTRPDVTWIIYLRAMGLYLSLAMFAFYQLRVVRPPQP